MTKQPLSPPDFTGVRPEHLLEAIQSCERGKGDEVLERFEQEFAELAGTKYAVAVSSATAGLHLAMLALEIGEGDEVVCPTFTFAASAFPITYTKAIPLFVDSEKTTWNLSPDYLEKAIKDRVAKGKKPKAIIVVHAYGMPADLENILEIANKYSVPLVEDSANALGSTWHGKQVGSLGELGVFSFNRNKIISGGAGGCVVSNDERLVKKVRYFAHQAKSNAPYYLHEQVGYNYGLSPILAELIRVQLPLLPDRVNYRRSVFENYKSFFCDNANAQIELAGYKSNRWLSTFCFKESEIQQALVQKSLNNQIEVKRLWKPMHTQPVFGTMPYFGGHESESFWQKGFCLPLDYQSFLQETYILVKP